MGNNSSKAQVYKSQYKDVAIPKTDLATFSFAAWEKHPDKELAVHGDRRVTYKQVKADALRFASALTESYGFQKGDVLALFAPNSIDWIVAFYGTLAAGGVVTTINPAYTTSEVTHQFRDSNPKIVLASPCCEAKVMEVKANVASVEHVIVFGAQESHPDSIAFDSVLQQGRADFQGPRVRHDEVAILPYSSGTTGVSKGVMLTHHNIVANCCQNIPTLDELEAPDCCMIALLPFFHIYGMQLFLVTGLSQGARLAIMPKFDPAEFLRILAEEGVTLAFVVPPIVNFLAKHPAVDQFADRIKGTLRTVFSGAAPLGRELGSAVADRLGCTIKQGYGMTEMSPVSNTMPASLALPENAGKIGTLLPNTRMQIVKEDGCSASAGEVGELWFKGPQVMKGYLNNEDATAAILDKEGWLHTGDVGCIDEEGMVTIVDRLKELIKVKGFQVAPAEVEASIQAHPGVADVAVIGASDTRAGEVVKAFVVAKDPAQPPTLADLQEHVLKSLAPYKAPVEMELVTEIPKSASGKILRRVLKGKPAAADGR
mmetsp:Transcript_29437/g.73998  ORF Transcript_29437/g.73998 Transcript_29437/m.73998 type:complete len:542 (-) Transcript_29437:178-1803(-)